MVSNGMVKDAPLPKPAAELLRSRGKRRRPLQVVGRLFRRLIQLLMAGVIVSVALAIGWLRSDDFQARSIRLATSTLELELGEPVELQRISVRFWPPGIDIDGLQISSAQTGQPIVSAERIRAPLALTARGPRLGRLELHNPVVWLHLDRQGKLEEFRDRAVHSGGAKLTELPWTSLRIIDGWIRLDHPEGWAQLDHLEAVPTDGPVTTLSGDLSLQVRDLHDQTSFSWTDVRLGPDTIEIGGFELDLTTLDVSGRARIPLDGPIDADLTASLDVDALQPLLPPPRAAHGRLDVDLRIEGPPSDPTAVIQAAGWGLRAELPGVFTPLLHYDFGELTLSAVARKEGIHIDQVVLPWAGGRVVAWGEITPDKRLENGHVTMEDVSLAPLLVAFDAAPTPWVDFRADSEVTWSGSLDPLRLEGTFDFGVANLHVGDGPIAAPTTGLMLDIPNAFAQGTLVLTKKNIVLRAPTVRGPRNAGSLVVDIGFGPRGPLDLDFDLHDADLEDFQPLADTELKGKGRVRGRIAGPFNHLTFEGSGDIRDFSVLGIEYADHLVADLHSPDMKSIYLTGAEATLGSSHYHGHYGIDFKTPISMNTAIEVDRGRVEDMVHMFLDLDGLKGDLTGTLTLDGPLFDMSGEQHIQLSDVEIYGERFPTGSAHGYMDRGVFTLDDLRVRRNNGRAGITLRGSVDREWALDMELVADGLDLARLDRLASYGLPLSGRLSAVSHITNTLFDPSPDGRIWLTDLRYAGVEAEDSMIVVDSEGGVARYEGDLLGRAAHVRGTLGLWGEQPYALTADLKDLPAHLFYPVAADGKPIRAEVSGEVSVSGHFGETWSPVDLLADIADVAVSYDGHVLRNDKGPWRYEQAGNHYVMSGFNLAGGATHLEFHADNSPETVSPYRGDGVIDLDLLRAVVPGLVKSSGTAAIQLRDQGIRPNVEPLVLVDLESDLFRHDSAPLSIEDTEGRIRITREGIALEGLKSKLGGGDLAVRGTIESRDWMPVRYDLSMDVRDAMVQWVESLPPAIGNGRFRFDGPADALLLSGDIDVTDMTFAERIDWEDWVVEYRDWMLVDPASITDEQPMFNLNVAIDADRTIHLQNNVAEGTASADLRIIGDTVRPGLVGTVTVEDDGLVFLQDREFRVDRGNLLFNDPWTWDPQLDIALLTDITSRDQRYRVDYQVKGPFSDWRTEARSDPPLPQADVNALLWFGITTDQLEEMGELSYAVAQGVADLLVTDFFVSGQAGEFGEEISDLLFDRIDVTTGVNARGQYSSEPRLVVEKRLPDNLANIDVKWELNLARPNDNYVNASKRIGGIWSLAGWYATLQRDRVLPIGGAYGVDVVARWEIE